MTFIIPILMVIIVQELKIYIYKRDYTRKIGLKGLYINAGVILFNLNKIREDNVIQKLFDNTIKMKDIIEYQDQDVINITFNGNIKEVDSIYNFAGSNMSQEKIRDPVL